MKKLALLFVIVSFVSCGILDIANKAQPTLIVSGTTGTVSAPSVGVINKELVLKEHTFYDIGELAVSIKTNSLDTILKLNLYRDSTIRIDVTETTINKNTYPRY
jgi:hypothetical protein